MRRQWCFIVGLLIAAFGVAFGQEELVKQVEDALRVKNRGVVYDFGKLLKPQGATELRQRTEQFRADGLNFYFVTIPEGGTSVDALAESIYRDMGMTANDVLIVFDGKRVYGKALALKGEPQAFQDALKEARPAFKLYHAKGLAHFAQSLYDRIVQRRAIEAAEQRAAAERLAVEKEAATKRRRVMGTIGLFVILVVVGAVSYPRLKQHAVTRKQYNERLASAKLLFQQVALKMPDDASDDITTEFLSLDQELHRCHERKGTTLADMDKLIVDLQKFDSRFAE